MRCLLLIFLLSFLFACSPVHVVKPLKKGEQRLGASLGGSLIKFGGAVLPIPNTSLQYARGLSHRVSGYASAYTTAAAFGLLQLDAGLCFNAYTLDSLKGFSLNLGLNGGSTFSSRGTALWPELALSYHHTYGSRANFFYAGTGTWVEMQATGTHGRTIDRRLLPWLHLGHTWNKGPWSYQAEFRWLAPDRSNEDIVVDYLRLTGTHGVSGLYFGLTRRIGK